MLTNRSLPMSLLKRVLLLALFLALATVPLATQAATNKIYFTTNDDYSVKRANTDGAGVEQLYTTPTGVPSGIIIDADTSKIYFTDSLDAKIQRMNLDGTGLETILTGARVVSIALDRYGGKIYFTTQDPGGNVDYSVKRANTDGTGVENLYTSDTGNLMAWRSTPGIVRSISPTLWTRIYSG